MTSPVTIAVRIDAQAALLALTAAPQQINRALRAAMTDATVLLMREMQTYPPPPDPIQGTANTPVRVFRARYTTRSGQTATRTVQIRANKMSGRGIRMASAAPLRYKRTNTLKRSWHRHITGEGFTIMGEVVSSGQAAPYNIYVQSDEHQARIHAGRWRTVSQVRGQNERDVVAFFDRRLREALR